MVGICSRQPPGAITPMPLQWKLSLTYTQINELMTN